MGDGVSLTALQILHEQVQARARAVAERHGAWPCRAGCDQCCRRLASLPVLSEAERVLLDEGLAGLPGDVRDAAEGRWAALKGAGRPIVCPLLDQASGMCLVYDHRPVACRTYGFYVERDRGLYCALIEQMVERGECDDVVWGNHAAVLAAVHRG